MRIGFAISAVLALAACGIEYNPSFARLKMADSEPEGYGSFEWDISFPPNTVKPGKVSFTLKREPGDLSVLSLGSDWIDLTNGQAAGRQDNIPAGAYFLDLHLGADFAYVSTHRVVSIKKDETSSLNLNFVTTDFIAYTLLNVKFTLKSEAPLTPDLTKITFHEADDCADSAFMSYNGGTDERSVSTNSLTTEYESIAWTAVPNNLGDPTNFKSEFYAKMFVRDTNGRVFKRISGPHTVEGQQPAAFDISFTTPLLQPAVIETPYPANGTANFVQNDALGNTFNSASYSGCDPLTAVTVYTTGNDSCFLKKISVEDNSEDDPLSSPLRELSANMSNRQENFEFLMPYIPVKIKVEWYSNFSMLAAERAAQTSNNSISYLRYATLKDAIDAAQTGETTYVLNNLTANGSASGGFSSSTSTISISNKSVTLSVKKDVSAVIKRATGFTSAAFFTVDNTSGILTLKGDGTGQLILDGGAVWSGGTGSPPSPANGATNSGVTASCPLVKISSGSLAIGSGAVLRNNSATYPALEISGGSTSMTGGSIEYNQNSNENNSAGGGGVEVSNGSFTMSEGVIKHNWARTGGGVHIPKNVPNNPQFVMKGTAVIEYNKAEGYGGGGIKTDKPISISEDAVVRYNEAKHTGNPGSDEEGNGEGGGVYVHEQKLNMTGNAKIHGNRASRNGAGVCARADLYYAVLSLSGSAVIDADNDVYLKNNDTIAIDGNLGGAFPVATVTPSDYVSGRLVLTGVSYLAANYDKFAVTPPQLGYWCGIKNDGKLSMPWVSTIAGGGSDPSILDGQGTTVQLSEPWGIAVDNSGNVYFADSGHHRIGKIDLSTNTVSTFAGTGTEGSTDGSLTSAKFNQPHGIAFNNNRTVLYVADRFNHLIRKIDLSTNMVSTFAGTAGDTSIMHDPWGVAVDSSGNVYVADTLNHRILKITSTGSVSTLAGTGTEGYFDGSGSSAQFNAPNDVAVDSVGNVYVADTVNGYARKITSGGDVSTLAGPPEGYFLPRGIVVDASGNIYVSEASAACIRKITDNGVVTIFAGIRSDGGYVDGAAVSAKFNLPTKMAIDSAGIYMSRIRTITVSER